MKFAFYTLGCKVNQYESQAMGQLLTARGHEVCDFSEDCHGYIINTCSVTAVADKKNRAIIRRCRKAHPDAVIAVCGCYTQHDPAAAEALGVDLIGGSADRSAFIDRLLNLCGDNVGRGLAPAAPASADPKINSHPHCHCEERSDVAISNTTSSTKIILDDPRKRREFEILPAGGAEGRTRAMLKVQDGCRNFCTYCIIPYTRGAVRSLPAEIAVEQAKALALQGYREIVITGIEIASWGVDLPEKPPLERLLAAVCTAVPELRIRLGSLEPRIITEAFCEAIAQFPNLCDHFHLSLQSGSDTVLARMHRKYDTARYLHSATLLRRFFPGCAITTDMIVAFPGETEEEFRESLAFIERCDFSDMHIFPYSRRPGTPADKMPGQHCNATKERRSREAIAVAEKRNLAYRENFVGKTLTVLFEEPEGAYFVGHTTNYLKVYVPETALHNCLLPVRITGIYADGLLAQLQPE